MAENKTKANKANKASVTEFLKTVTPDTRRECKVLMAMMKTATGKRPKMWGSTIVGYGSYHYRYESGREGDMCVTGFSPRKQALTVYIIPGFKPYATLMKKLGKYKLGKCCLYLKRLSDVDEKALQQLITRSVKDMSKKYECS